jgi:hypothetical protein
LTIIIGLLYLQLTDHANVPWAVDIIIFMQGFPETWKLFQGFLQGKKIGKGWSISTILQGCISQKAIIYSHHISFDILQWSINYCYQTEVWLQLVALLFQTLKQRGSSKSSIFYGVLLTHISESYIRRPMLSVSTVTTVWRVLWLRI